MCGISGIFSKNIIDQNHFLKYSNFFLKRRGPDNQSFYKDKTLNLLLYHSRLSVIDVDKRSNQPNNFDDDQYVITYNGELYNYLELKKILISKKVKFNSTSDTEVLLKYIKHFSLDLSLDKFNGMFAFALFDKKRNNIYLVRDRFGQKPLYYFIDNNSFIFSSEIKVICKYLGKNINGSLENLSDYLDLSYFPGTKTPFKDIFKVPAGSFIKINLDKLSKKSHKYWEFNDFKIPKKIGDESSIVNECEDVILQSLEKTMRSDVPISFYLSSGTDSSLICALAKKKLNREVKSYTLKNKDLSHDESDDAKFISNYLNIENISISISEKILKERIENIFKIYQEPFADSSQLAIDFLNRSIKEKVIISGDGGDELFGGYNRYQWLIKVDKIKKILPNIVFRAFFNSLSYLGKSRIESLPNFFHKEYFLYDKIQKFLKSCCAKNDLESYLAVVSKNYNYLVFNNSIKKNYENLWNSDLSLFNKISFADLNNYMIDDILVKVDRSCMYHSIENRTPFLNNEVIQYSQNLHQRYKLNGNIKKWILKKILEKYLPKNYIHKPKRGFKIPIGDWMKNELYDYFKQKILIIKDQKFCNFSTFINYWEDHINNKKNNEELLWNYFVLSNWIENFESE